MYTFVFHTNIITEYQLSLISKVFSSLYSADALKPHKNHYRLTVNTSDVLPSNETLQSLSHEIKVDVNMLPTGFDSSIVKLVLCDMDSTLINVECLDEIADFIGVKSQVSQITESAMKGDIAFEESLIKRVGLLAGIETSVLQKVFDERVRLNPGAKEWLQGLKEQKIKFALISGGFTFFSQRLQDDLGLDYNRANVLGEENGKLTGGVVGDIVGPQSKANFLNELCEKLGILPNQLIAVGDGANDLLMMREAGLSVAYNAKPKVQQEADTSLNYSKLDAILDFLD